MSIPAERRMMTAPTDGLTQPGAGTPSCRSRRHLIAAVLLGAALLLGLVPVLFDHWWYPAHYLTDLQVDYAYARITIEGGAPYRSFYPEYPPLSLWMIVPPALRLGARSAGFARYQRQFAAEMLLLAGLCAALVALMAQRLWRDARHTYLAVAAFVALVLAIGPLVEDRFDMGVALFTALILLALIYGRAALAALLVGFGFAYKVTPIVLLPLVVSVTGWSRRTLLALGLCALAALAGFLPYLVTASAGIKHLFTYQTQRPLELESVLGLPVIVAHLIGGGPMYIGVSHRSWSLEGFGSQTLTHLSTPLTAVALLAVSVLLWRRRAALRAQPRKLPLGVLALYLAFLCGDRVLSPQYLIWVFPAAALVLLDDLPLGLTMLATTVLTQVEFPVAWPGILVLRPVDLVWLCVRNVALLGAFALALWHLWHLPAEPRGPAVALPNELGEARKRVGGVKVESSCVGS